MQAPAYQRLLWPPWLTETSPFRGLKDPVSLPFLSSFCSITLHLGIYTVSIFIMTLTHHIVRRGLEAANEALSKPHKPDDGNPDETPINPIALLVIAATMLFFFFVLFTVSLIQPRPE